MTYNLSNMSTATNMFSFQTAVNEVTGGMYAVLLLFAFYIILIISMKNYETTTAVLVATFSTFIVTGLFVFLGMLGWVHFSVVLGILVAVLIFSVWRKE